MILQKKTIERIAKDVKYIIKNPLDNIYYKHNENNILSGYALIIGPLDTPYNYGNYLFKFDFPENYPFSPPKLTFLSNNGTTRFNPNLYINGKVCLSILNTWKGESWTSCQTISSILLILSSILTEKPLINEPGITENNNLINVNNYNLIIKYKNIEYTIIKQIEYLLTNIDKNSNNNDNKNSNNNDNKNPNNNDNKNILYKEVLFMFKDEIIENFLKNHNNIENIINTSFNNVFEISESIFNSKIIINNKELFNNFNKIKMKINKIEN